MVECPHCSSTKIRRGGTTIWMVYLALVALAIPAVVVFQFDAAIVAGIMIAVVVLVNLVIGTRVCLDCGHQWRT